MQASQRVNQLTSVKHQPLGSKLIKRWCDHVRLVVGRVHCRAKVINHNVKNVLGVRWQEMCVCAPQDNLLGAGSSVAAVWV
jgi:hypothetical protein